MYYCDNYLFAVVLCVVTMFCWGSWGNTQKLAGKTWRYELFYWDYVIGILLFSVAMGLTMGSCGEKAAWGFVANLKSSFGMNWLWPILSGVVFNASNILLVAAIAVAGMSVAFPVGVGLALVGGTLLNFAVKRQGSPALIALGLALIVMSILCNAMAFKAKQGGAAGATDASATKKGLVLAALAGLMMMWFSPLVNRVVDLTFTAPAPKPGMLTPYTGFFLFAVGIFLSNFLFNTIAMRKPVQGEPIRDGLRRYFGGSAGTHLVGVLGGWIWGLGTLLSFVSAGKAGPAISYALGQGATLVSALWGILVWKEFAGAPKKSTVLNVAMFLLFLAGLGAIIAAGKTETPAKEPVKVIFDTDMYTDFDDAGALACLHALADAGECEILATVANTRDCLSVAMCEIINAFYGRPGIPVGCSKELGVTGASSVHLKRYEATVKKYGAWVKTPNSNAAPDANTVYRRILAAQPDNSVVICSVGFLTNMRRLLETKADEFSPLDGKALVAKKVKTWVAMACKYPYGTEYNSMKDPPSSAFALANWPTPVIVTDFEYGRDVFSGRALAEAPVKNNPVSDVFAGNIPSRESIRQDPGRHLRGAYGMGGRAAWDQTAVLIAVRGTDALFNTERGTYRMVDEKGTNEWAPSADGPHVRVTEKVAKADIGRLIDELMIRPPRTPACLCGAAH